MNVRKTVEVTDERHAAKAQSNFHHEGHEEHEERPVRWAASKLRVVRPTIRQNHSFSGRIVRGMIVRGMAREALKFYSPVNHSSDTSGLPLHHPCFGCGWPRYALPGEGIFSEQYAFWKLPHRRSPTKWSCGSNVARQSRMIGTARRAVRSRFFPGRSPRRGDPTIPRPVVTDPLRSNRSQSTSKCSPPKNLCSSVHVCGFHFVVKFKHGN